MYKTTTFIEGWAKHEVQAPDNSKPFANDHKTEREKRNKPNHRRANRGVFLAPNGRIKKIK